MEWFYLRSRSIADWTEGSLLREVFSELIDYLTPLYLDALLELKKRSEEVEATFENEEIMNFFRAHRVFEGRNEELGSHSQIRVRVRDPRVDAEGEFQMKFERMLQTQNVRLRVNLKDKTVG